MGTDKITEKISDLLPERGTDPGAGDTRLEEAKERAADIVRRETAKELSRMRASERQRLARMMKKADGPQRTPKQQEAIEQQEALVATVDALEEMNRGDVAGLAAKGAAAVAPERVAMLQTTTRRDTAVLLSKLGINLNVQLTKADTANLLACLLTCDEAQLDRLYANRKVPLAIKTVIKRIIKDAREGNTSTVERLWDRIFGKAPLVQDMSAQAAQQQGLIPGTPISREAYIILRDTLIK